MNKKVLLLIIYFIIYFILKDLNKKFDLNNVKLTKENIYEIIIFWFKNDLDVIILTKDEFEAKKTIDGFLKEITIYNENEKNDSFYSTKSKKLHENIKNTIKNYEILLENTNDEEEKKILKDMILNLEKHFENANKKKGENNLSTVENQSFIDKNVKKNALTEELKLKYLRNIYDFYNKERFASAKYSFDRKMHDLCFMDFGKFNHFCNHFDLYKINKFLNKQVNKLLKLFLNIFIFISQCFIYSINAPQIKKNFLLMNLTFIKKKLNFLIN